MKCPSFTLLARQAVLWDWQGYPPAMICCRYSRQYHSEVAW